MLSNCINFTKGCLLLSKAADLFILFLYQKLVLCHKVTKTHVHDRISCCNRTKMSQDIGNEILDKKNSKTLDKQYPNIVGGNLL